MEIKSIESLFNPGSILDSIADGVYVTDLDRNIVFWNKAAERITGWKKEDVLGRSCMDQILCHVDKENRRLCGKDTCPLYRSITTNKPAAIPVIVFGQTRDGNRVPLQVIVSPVHDEQGKVLGGVEVFRDVTETMKDLARAKEIQSKSLKWNLDADFGVEASVHYTPHDMIGGDFYAVEQVNATQMVFLLADVMGHGTSAALYTMYLRSLWQEYFNLFPRIDKFIGQLNHQLHQLMSDNFSFAAAICGLIDLEKGVVSLVGGGMPNPFLINSKAETIRPDVSGFALGMLPSSNYTIQTSIIKPGDILFLFTDGATEIMDSNQKILGEDGLQEILTTLGYPGKHARHQEIEEQLIDYSGDIALNDDVTYLEFRIPDK